MNKLETNCNREGKYDVTLPWQKNFQITTMGSLSNDDGDGNENNKEATNLDQQNNNFIRTSRFFVHSWPSLHDCDRKLTNFTRPPYGVGEHSAKFSFFLFLPETVPLDSTPDNFANI